MVGMRPSSSCGANPRSPARQYARERDQAPSRSKRSSFSPGAPERLPFASPIPGHRRTDLCLPGDLTGSRWSGA